MMSIFSADELEETLITELDNMKAAKVKMEEVRQENETLKLTLSQMMKNYHSLKMQLNGAVRDDRSSKTTNSAPMAASDDESELVCLSLGRFSGDYSRREEKKARINVNLENCGLELGLDLKSHSGDCTEATDDLKLGNSFDEAKKDGNNDVVRSPEKSPKTSRSGDDEILQYNPVKKPRVSVKAVCNTQTMHDGCQWRKYGQKVAKGNPCPRAYYRCTVSSSCPVRKQVQRCIDDMRILTTTYEGTHNHPLPPSATAMASTTSAAASMLNCGSTASANRFGFNFPSPNNLITIASSQSHPTVILDLTAPNHTLNKLSPSLFPPKHSSSTSLNFSSNPQNTLQLGWENRFHPYPQPSANPKQTANDRKIAEATQAIARDPSFQSALAAAITSFVGSNDGQGRNFGLNFSQASTINGSVGCGPSFLSKFPPMGNSQQMNLTRFAPVTLSASKSQAVSLADETEERKLS